MLCCISCKIAIDWRLPPFRCAIFPYHLMLSWSCFSSVRFPIFRPAKFPRSFLYHSPSQHPSTTSSFLELQCCMLTRPILCFKCRRCFQVRVSKLPQCEWTQGPSTQITPQMAFTTAPQTAPNCENRRPNHNPIIGGGPS